MPKLVVKRETPPYILYLVQFALWLAICTLPVLWFWSVLPSQPLISPLFAQAGVSNTTAGQNQRALVAQNLVKSAIPLALGHWLAFSPTLPLSVAYSPLPAKRIPISLPTKSACTNSKKGFKTRLAKVSVSLASQNDLSLLAGKRAAKVAARHSVSPQHYLQRTPLSAEYAARQNDLRILE